VAKSTYTYDTATLALDTETIAYDLNADSTPDFTRVIDKCNHAPTNGVGVPFHLKN